MDSIYDGLPYDECDGVGLYVVEWLMEEWMVFWEWKETPIFDEKWVAQWGFQEKKGRARNAQSGLFLKQSARADLSALERTHLEASWLEQI